MKPVCPQHVAGTADAERAMRGGDAFVAAMFIFPPPSLVRCLHAAAKGFPPSQVLDCKIGLLSSVEFRGRGELIYIPILAFETERRFVAWELEPSATDIAAAGA